MIERTGTYAVVTPARNEARNLLRLADCLDRQTHSPQAWVIVDNGSTDDTPAVAEQLAESRPWVRVTHAPGQGASVRGGPVARAFHAGYAVLPCDPEVIVKVDADVSVAEDFFARLVDAFSDARLGIASGTCYELDDGEWTQRHVTGSSVWGATRAYRAECLTAVMPLEEHMGWDGVDELKARLRGWETRTILDLPFRHHRAEGQRDGNRWRAWAAGGRASYFMGYRSWYLFARALFNMRHEIAALGLVSGYATAAMRRDPRCTDPEVITFLRQQQRLSNLPRRAREATGRHSTAGA